MSTLQYGILGLAVSAMVSFFAPFVVYVVCRRRMALSLRNVAVGAVVFGLAVLVLEAAMHWYILFRNPTTAALFRTNLWAFAVYGAAAAALYEETGRYLALRFFARRTTGPGAAVSYGIGHGGAESIVIGGFGFLQAILMAEMAKSGTLSLLVGQKLSPDALAKLQASLVHLDFAHALIGGVERLCALLIQIALSLLVWRAVSRKDIRWFLLALACHFALDFPAALTQKGVIPVFATEAYVWVIGAALLIFFLIKLPRKSSALPPA